MESHPGRETEEKRIYARRKLRDIAERRLSRYGQPSPGVDPGLGVSDVGVRFRDGTMGHLTRINIGQTDVIKINVYQTEDPLGPMTQYTSWKPGEFTRADINPQDSGSLSLEEAQDLGGEAMEAAIAAGSILGAASLIQNSQEGIDNHPITAQEARDLHERLNDARIGNSRTTL